MVVGFGGVVDHRQRRSLNSARTLADRFRTQRTDRIRVDGIEVVSMLEIQLEQSESVELVVEQCRGDVDQAINVRSPEHDLVVATNIEPSVSDDGFDEDDLDLDLGSGVEVVTVVVSDQFATELTGSRNRAETLQLWNSWSLGQGQHSWTGNSGIVMEELDAPVGASRRVRLWCSDGLGDPEFDDLVVLVTVGTRQDPDAEAPSSEEE